MHWHILIIGCSLFSILHVGCSDMQQATYWGKFKFYALNSSHILDPKLLSSYS